MKETANSAVEVTRIGFKFTKILVNFNRILVSSTGIF